jgi:hypothetical protein
MVDDVINAIANVVASIDVIKAHEAKIDAIAALLTDILTGTLVTINLDGTVLVSDLIDDANAISDVFFRDSNIINVACEEAKALYGNTIAGHIFSAIPAFMVDDVINAIANVAKLIIGKECLISDVARLATDVLDGQLGIIGYHANALVTVILTDVKLIVEHLTASPVVYATFAELNVLYNEAIIGDIIQETLAIELRDLVTSIANVIVTALPVESKCIVRDIANVINNVFEGKLSSIGFAKDELVTDTLANINAIVDHLVISDTLDAIFAEAKALYGDTTMKDVFRAIPAFKVDGVINAVANVAASVDAIKVHANKIYAVAKLATDMFGGTPSNLAISIMDKANVEIIAGVNLPMLIKLAALRKDCGLKDVVIGAQDAGKKYINIASQLLG